MGSNQYIIDTINIDELDTVIPFIYNNNKIFHKDIIIDGINLNIDLLYNHNIIVQNLWQNETKIDDFLICYLDEVYLKIIRTFKNNDNAIISFSLAVPTFGGHWIAIVVIKEKSKSNQYIVIDTFIDPTSESYYTKYINFIKYILETSTINYNDDNIIKKCLTSCKSNYNGFKYFENFVNKNISIDNKLTMFMCIFDDLIIIYTNNKNNENIIKTIIILFYYCYKTEKQDVTQKLIDLNTSLYGKYNNIDNLLSYYSFFLEHYINEKKTQTNPSFFDPAKYAKLIEINLLDIENSTIGNKYKFKPITILHQILCKTCTFLNSPSNTYCTICNTKL
jgi:hypothetical protein